MFNDWDACVHFSSPLIDVSLNQILAYSYEVINIPSIMLACVTLFKVCNGLLIMLQRFSYLFCKNLSFFL